MKTIRENINGLPYSLHDMHVTKLEKKEDEMVLYFKDGFEKIVGECKQVKGEVHLQKVDWDFCFSYLLDFADNEGTFTGKKQFLADFIDENETLDFEIVDETYGYYSSRFDGYMWANERAYECTLEIYHLGDMEYVTEE